METKIFVLNLLLIVVTGTENLDQNAILEYFQQESLFDCVFQVKKKQTNKNNLP